MKFIVNPYVENQKREEISQKRKQNMHRLIETKKEADAVRKLLKQTYEKVHKEESESNGLIIHRALYGKTAVVQAAASSTETPQSGDIIDVMLPVQCLVRSSQLIQPAASKVRFKIRGFNCGFH